ncbi:hypothetical protein HRbin35_00333 [bacterium HR35]|nr:hypothetical protein HRbin35_00333 [bacterium HR35]
MQREINRIKSDRELLQLPRTFRDLESKIKSSKLKPTFDNFSKLVSGLNNHPNLSSYRDFFVQLEGEIRGWLENIRGFIENISRKINDLIQNLEENSSNLF